jgi:hypothetical protein
MTFGVFQNLKIELWFHQGRIGASPDCLCAFHSSAERGKEWLDALLDLSARDHDQKRTLTFAACDRLLAIHKLVLTVSPPSDDLKVLSIRRDADSAAIKMTPEGLEIVIEGVQSWLAGTEDFGVSPAHSRRIPKKQFGRLDRESLELWFWGPGLLGP